MRRRLASKTWACLSQWTSLSASAIQSIPWAAAGQRVCGKSLLRRKLISRLWRLRLCRPLARVDVPGETQDWAGSDSLRRIFAERGELTPTDGRATILTVHLRLGQWNRRSTSQLYVAVSKAELRGVANQICAGAVVKHSRGEVYPMGEEQDDDDPVLRGIAEGFDDLAGLIERAILSGLYDELGSVGLDALRRAKSAAEDGARAARKCLPEKREARRAS